MRRALTGRSDRGRESRQNGLGRSPAFASWMPLSPDCTNEAAATMSCCARSRTTRRLAGWTPRRKRTATGHTSSVTRCFSCAGILTRAFAHLNTQHERRQKPPSRASRGPTRCICGCGRPEILPSRHAHDCWTTSVAVTRSAPVSPVTTVWEPSERLRRRNGITRSPLKDARPISRASSSP